MAETSWPYDNQLSYEDNWREMASKWLGDGVLYGELNNLAVSGDSTGMNVKIATGKAWVQGTFYSNSTQRTGTIAAAPSIGNTRRDRVVLRNDMVANSTVAMVLAGTPVAIPGTPVARALTKSTTVWEISLGTVLVPAGTVTIGPSAVTDDRSYAVPLNSPFAAPTSSWAAVAGVIPTPTQAPARLRMTGGHLVTALDVNGCFSIQLDPASVALISGWAVSGDMTANAGFFVLRPDWSTRTDVVFQVFKATDATQMPSGALVRAIWGCIYAV